MFKLIAINSFRRGTGKSSLAANIAALLATEKRRVGVMDMDFQSPNQHILFGLDDNQIAHTLNDYLRGKCEIEQAVYDMTLRLGEQVKGQLYLIPASTRLSDILGMANESFAIELLNNGFRKLIEILTLDVLVVDTSAGLCEETLNSVAISDALAVVLRPDQQDYQGTAVVVGVAQRLDVPRLMLVVNNVPAIFDFDQVRTQVEQAYGCEVAAVLPHSEEMMALAGVGIFAFRFPDHPVTKDLKKVAAELIK